jgi:hypothetical protein
MNPNHSDRNLLFGVLALQMDFLGRDAHIDAMHAWVLDKTKSLLGRSTGEKSLRKAFNCRSWASAHSFSHSTGGRT